MDINGRPDHIMDYLATVRSGQWFGWAKGDAPRMVYANLIVHDGGNKPTKQECIDGLSAMQTSYDDAKTKPETDSSSGKAKLKALGLSDDEIKALTGK